jgi:hypothetical protein
MTADWTPARTLDAPFSLEVGKIYAQELAQTFARCKMDDATKREYIREFAKLTIEIYRRQTVRIQ